MTVSKDSRFARRKLNNFVVKDYRSSLQSSPPALLHGCWLFHLLPYYHIVKDNRFCVDETHGRSQILPELRNQSIAKYDLIFLAPQYFK